MIVAVALCGAVLMPPAQYAEAWHPEPIIRQVDYWQVDQICRDYGGIDYRDAGKRYEACSKGLVIVLPKIGDGVSAQFQDCLLKHEMAHLAGWPADHPGAVYE